MRTIIVKQRFTLNKCDEHVVFEPGVCEVSEEVAEHWYVKLHAEPYQAPPQPKPEPVQEELEEAEKPEADEEAETDLFDEIDDEEPVVEKVSPKGKKGKR